MQSRFSRYSQRYLLLGYSACYWWSHIRESSFDPGTHDALCALCTSTSKTRSYGFKSCASITDMSSQVLHSKTCRSVYAPTRLYRGRQRCSPVGSISSSHAVHECRGLFYKPILVTWHKIGFSRKCTLPPSSTWLEPSRDISRQVSMPTSHPGMEQKQSL